MLKRITIFVILFAVMSSYLVWGQATELSSPSIRTPPFTIHFDINGKLFIGAERPPDTDVTIATRDIDGTYEYVIQSYDGEIAVGYGEPFSAVDLNVCKNIRPGSIYTAYSRREDDITLKEQHHTICYRQPEGKYGKIGLTRIPATDPGMIKEKIKVEFEFLEQEPDLEKYTGPAYEGYIVEFDQEPVSEIIDDYELSLDNLETQQEIFKEDLLEEAEELAEMSRSALPVDLEEQQAKLQSLQDALSAMGQRETKIRAEESNKIKTKVDELKKQHEEFMQLIRDLIGTTDPDLEFLGETEWSLNGLGVYVDDDFVDDIEKLPNVKKVHKNYIVTSTLSESVPLIKTPEVWNLVDSKGNKIRGKGIKVGVLDTGVDYTHPDLGRCTTEQFLNKQCAKVVDGFDFTRQKFNDLNGNGIISSKENECTSSNRFSKERDNDPYDVPGSGHGTHVAATIGGNGKSSGITGGQLDGVAPDVSIVGYRVLNECGSGSSFDIIDAIDRSWDPNQDGNTADKLDVISLSLGGCGDPDDASSIAIDRAVDSGVVSVIAAGNSGDETAEQMAAKCGAGMTSQIGSPGTARKAITIGASEDGSSGTTTDTTADFSSKGPTNPGGDTQVVLTKPDVLAPGWAINAAIPLNKYSIKGGTSMATPHVSGVIALMLQKNPGITPAQVKEILMKTTKEKQADPNFQQNNERGTGRIDALAAVNAVPGLTQPTPVPTATPIPATPTPAPTQEPTPQPTATPTHAPEITPTPETPSGTPNTLEIPLTEITYPKTQYIEPTQTLLITHDNGINWLTATTPGTILYVRYTNIPTTFDTITEQDCKKQSTTDYYTYPDSVKYFTNRPTCYTTKTGQHGKIQITETTKNNQPHIKITTQQFTTTQEPTLTPAPTPTPAPAVEITLPTTRTPTFTLHLDSDDGKAYVGATRPDNAEITIKLIDNQDIYDYESQTTGVIKIARTSQAFADTNLNACKTSAYNTNQKATLQPHDTLCFLTTTNKYGKIGMTRIPAGAGDIKEKVKVEFAFLEEVIATPVPITPTPVPVTPTPTPTPQPETPGQVPIFQEITLGLVKSGDKNYIALDLDQIDKALDAGKTIEQDKQNIETSTLNLALSQDKIVYTSIRGGKTGVPPKSYAELNPDDCATKTTQFDNTYGSMNTGVLCYTTPKGRTGKIGDVKILSDGTGQMKLLVWTGEITTAPTPQPTATPTPATPTPKPETPTPTPTPVPGIISGEPNTLEMPLTEITYPKTQYIEPTQTLLITHDNGINWLTATTPGTILYVRYTNIPTTFDTITEQDCKKQSTTDYYTYPDSVKYFTNRPTCYTTKTGQHGKIQITETTKNNQPHIKITTQQFTTTTTPTGNVIRNLIRYFNWR